MQAYPVITHILVALLTWGLASLAFFPADLFFLAWVAFVPWMVWHGSRPRKGTVRALTVAFYFYFASSLSWVGVVAPPLVFLIPFFGLPTAILLAVLVDVGVHRLRLPAFFVHPLAIVSTDLLREQLLSLTWCGIGYSQWRWIEGVQSASVFRVHALSLVVLLANAALAQLVLRWLGGPGRPSLRRVGIGVGTAAAAALVLHLFGAARLERETLEPGPLAVGVQGNIPQRIKQREDWKHILRKQVRVYEGRDPTGPDPDLLVFAETAFPSVSLPDWPLDLTLDARSYLPGRTIRDVLPKGRGQVTIVGHTLRKPVAEGNGGGDLAFERWNGAAVLLDAREEIAFYAKRILVPCGEYIPLPETFPWREELVALVEETAGFLPDNTPGSGPTCSSVSVGGRTFPFSLSICYEMVFPQLLRGDVRTCNPVFMVNISNDAWYETSSELDLVHVAVRFRAVECGRSIFRVSNSGISTCVDALGRYVATVEDTDGRRKAVEGTLVARVPVTDMETPWVAHGDLLPGVFPLALVLLLTGGGVARLRERRSPAGA
jgi:apolipoprotein N-acyltransferase